MWNNRLFSSQLHTRQLQVKDEETEVNDTRNRKIKEKQTEKLYIIDATDL